MYLKQFCPLNDERFSINKIHGKWKMALRQAQEWKGIVFRLVFDVVFFVFLQKKVKRFIVIAFLIFWGTQIFAQNNPCSAFSNYHIVVLGSSTAAGAGASTPDSAWVNRYRAYLQDLNPGNTVTNLAVGGYTSYKLMPDDYTPPASRPTPDTSHNIDAALELSPDAIIINLPSNDVASGFALSEQIHNLDTIVEIATAAGIPIWITTTQPRNMTVAYMQLQEDMKDSIFVHYSPHVIDFWTTAAMPDNTINPIYDSGDGVHQNDAGHALMCERVIDVYIPDSLYVPSGIPDYGIYGLNVSQQTLCGDSSASIELQAVNLGINDMNSASVMLEIENISTSQIINDTLHIVNGVNTCESDTITYTFSSYEAGTYSISATIYHSLDTTASNNNDLVLLISSGHPQPLSLTNDTLCQDGFATLECLSEINDHVYWYNNFSGGSPIDSGMVYHTPQLSATTSYYPQIVRGNLFFSDSVLTQKNSSINWNGCMFDLVAHEDIIIDSLDVKIHSTGNQGIQVYKKPGSYLGYETDNFAWTLLGEDTVYVNSSTDFTSVHPGTFSMSAGDTIGIYIQLSNSSSTLSYYSSGSERIDSTNELTIITGSGIVHNFGGSYYPRNWCGQVFYHYGYRPQGDCVSDRYESTGFVNTLNFSIGNDTIIDILDEIVLSGPAGMASYLWSDNSTGQTLHISADSLGTGIHFIWLSVSDSLSCIFKDSLILGVADLAGMEDLNSDFAVYPNPFSDEIHISTTQIITYAKLIAADGREFALVLKPGSSDFVCVPENELNAGVYILQIITKENTIKNLQIIKK